MKTCLHRDAVLMFPAGGMFWARPAALEPLMTCVKSMEALPPEPLPVDGSSLHAIERLIAHSCETSSHHWKLLCDDKTSANKTSEPISVLDARPIEFQQATAQLAAQLRQIDEQLLCSETNLERSTQQIEELNEQIMRMENSRSWRLIRWVKRLTTIGS